MFARRAYLYPVDGYRQAVTTDHLLRKSQNTFDQRHPVREVPAVGQESRERFGWKCHDEISDNEPVRWPHAIESHRDTFGCIPDEARDGLRTDGDCFQRSRGRHQG